MKILQVIASTAPAGGGPIEAILQAGVFLKAHGHVSEIACLDPPDAPWLADLGLPTHALGPGTTGYGYCPRFRKWLRDQCQRYDCVISHGLWQYTSLGVWQSLRGCGVPYFVYTHGMLDPSFKQTFRLKHLKKKLYWPLAEHRVLRDARAVFFTCPQEQQLAQETFWPYRCSGRIVPYCVGSPPNDPHAEADRFLQAYPALRGRRLLLFLSRIHPKKGCDLLIRAFAQTAAQDPTWQLVMAGPGSGSWPAELRALAKSLGIAERITWTGMLLGSDKWAALRAAEVFVLPTWQENFGIAIVEALACGTPVLITDRVNIAPEIAADGAGFVAGSGLDGAVELLQRWLQVAPREQVDMQRRAKECFAGRFSSEQAGQRLLETLRSCGVAEQQQQSVGCR